MEPLKLWPRPPRTLEDIQEEIIENQKKLIVIYKQDEKRYLRIIELQDKVIATERAYSANRDRFVRFLLWGRFIH